MEIVAFGFVGVVVVFEVWQLWEGGGRIVRAIESLAESHAEMARQSRELQYRAGEAIEKTFHTVR